MTIHAIYDINLLLLFYVFHLKLVIKWNKIKHATHHTLHTWFLDIQCRAYAIVLVRFSSPHQYARSGWAVAMRHRCLLGHVLLWVFIEGIGLHRPVSLFGGLCWMHAFMLFWSLNWRSSKLQAELYKVRSFKSLFGRDNKIV